jgi:hypothetical protein
MAKLNPSACRTTLFDAMIDERPGVRREALSLVGHRLDETDAQSLEARWPHATLVARRTLAAAMLRLPPWPALAALLTAAAGDPDREQGAAVQALAAWRPEHMAYYAPLPPAEDTRALIEQRLSSASPALSREQRDRIRAALNIRH